MEEKDPGTSRPPLAPLSVQRAAMDSPFIRAREALRDCALEMGDADFEEYTGVILIKRNAKLKECPRFNFPPEKPLNNLEREIVAAIRRAGKPLQQKEISKAARVSLRLVQDSTPELVRRKVLLRHPSLGFYLPGQTITE